MTAVAKPSPTDVGSVRKVIPLSDYHLYADSATWPPESQGCITAELADPWYEPNPDEIAKVMATGCAWDMPAEIIVGWFPDHYQTQKREHQHLLHLLSFRFAACFSEFLTEQVGVTVSGPPEWWAARIDEHFVDLLLICKTPEDRLQFELMWPQWFEDYKVRTSTT